MKRVRKMKIIMEKEMNSIAKYLRTNDSINYKMVVVQVERSLT